MIAIGLGKQSGAAACHARGFSQMARTIPAMAEVLIERTPIRFGVAILENAYDQPFRLDVVPANEILAREPALLELARAAMVRLPFDAFDVLILDQIGKDISGDGADPNVTGRYVTSDAGGGPAVTTQVVLPYRRHWRQRGRPGHGRLHNHTRPAQGRAGDDVSERPDGHGATNGVPAHDLALGSARHRRRHPDLPCGRTAA